MTGASSLDGIFTLSQAAGLFKLSEIPEPPPLTTWDVGFPEWRGKVALAPATLSVVSGHPGHGKTFLMAQVIFNVVARYDLVAVIATFETRAKPHYRRMLRQFWAKILERDMTDRMIAEADAWIDDHYRWLVHPAETPTLEWIIDMVELSVERDGAGIFQIDPWNRLESQRNKDETETEYIAWCIRNLHVFAKSRNIHGQIVAHPAKRDSRMRDRVPELEDISGSKAWDSMPDQGFVVHRKRFWDDEKGRCYDAELYHRKARFEELGYPCVLDIEMDPRTGAFASKRREAQAHPATAKFDE